MIFEEASPTFKHRFMFMSGITDEREFDDCRRTLDWHGYAERVKAPYLIAGGKADHLCRLENSIAFAKALGGGVPAAPNGPDPRDHQAKDPGAARRQAVCQRTLVRRPSGQIDKAALTRPRAGRLIAA